MSDSCNPMYCSLPGSSVDSPGKNPGVGCHFLLQRICRTHTLKRMDLTPAGSGSSLCPARLPGSLLCQPHVTLSSCPFSRAGSLKGSGWGYLGPQEIQNSSALSSLLLNPGAQVSFCRYWKQVQAWKENGPPRLDRGCFRSISSYFI